MFILPINRDMDVDKVPRAVVCLIVINSVLLAMTYAAGSRAVFHQYGFTPAHPQLLTIFTSMFVHAGIGHLIGNMWFLWMFGKEVENSFGVWLFSLVYLLCGVGGTLLHYFF